MLSKKAFQSNTNHPLSDSPCFTVNLNVSRGGGLVSVQGDIVLHKWGTGT